MPSFVFTQAKLDILNGTIDLSSDNFYAILVGGSTNYTPSESFTQRNSLVLITGTNSEPQDLINRSLALNGSTVELTYTNPVWNALSATNNPITGIVICKKVGGTFASTDPVMAFLEFSAEYTSTGSTFQVTATNNVYLSVT